MDRLQAVKAYEEEQKRKLPILGQENYSNPVLTRGTVVQDGMITQGAQGKISNMAPGRLNEIKKLDEIYGPPKINETLNTQRDTELGKMTSNAINLPNGGQRNTFNIGGNTLSTNLSANDMVVKRNLADINNAIVNGAVPTPEQAQILAEKKRNAGFMLGGTDRVPVGPDGKPLSKQQNLNSITSAGGLQMTFPEGTEQNTLDSWKNKSRQLDIEAANRPKSSTVQEAPKLKDLLFKPGDGSGLTKKGIREANSKVIEDYYNKPNVDIAKEKNVIDRSNIDSQNKLRDIQGQATLNPQVAEKDVYDKKDVYNDLGQVVRQDLYNKRTGETKDTPKFTDSQSDIIKGLQKMRQSKDPKLAAAEAKYKANFGNLPY